MVRKKIICFKEGSSCLVIMVSIVLEMREVIAIGRWSEGSDLSPFLGIEKTWEVSKKKRIYQECWKVEKAC